MQATAPHPDVTDTELAVLEAIWDGEVNCRPIAERIYSEHGEVQNSTVQKLLDRLREKGFVRRDRGTFPNRYEANVSRGEIVTHHLRQIASKLCHGTMSALFKPLVRNSDLSKQERDSLREILDSLD